MIERKKRRVSEEMSEPVQPPEKPKSLVEKVVSLFSKSSAELEPYIPSVNVYTTHRTDHSTRNEFRDFALDETLYAFEIGSGLIPYKKERGFQPKRNDLDFPLERDEEGVFAYVLMDGMDTSKIVGILTRNQKTHIDSELMPYASMGDDIFSDPVLLPMPHVRGFSNYHEIENQIFRGLAHHYRRERDIERKRLMSESARYSRSLAESKSKTTRFQRSLLQLKAEKDQLEEETRLDQKTKLYNLKVLNEMKSQFIADALAGGYELGIGFGDIHKFKQYNSRDPSMNLGDQVIMGVGEAIRNSTRRDGEYGFRRLDPTGGASDEFIFVFERKTREESQKSMELINRNVGTLCVTREGYGFVVPEGHYDTVSLDTGIAYFSPESLAEQLIPENYGSQEDYFSHLFDRKLEDAMKFAIASKMLVGGGRHVLTEQGVSSMPEDLPSLIGEQPTVDYNPTRRLPKIDLNLA